MLHLQAQEELAFAAFLIGPALAPVLWRSDAALGLRTTWQALPLSLALIYAASCPWRLVVTVLSYHKGFLCKTLAFECSSVLQPWGEQS